MDEVQEIGRSLVVTKRGKPVVQVVPATNGRNRRRAPFSDAGGIYHDRGRSGRPDQAGIFAGRLRHAENDSARYSYRGRMSLSPRRLSHRATLAIRLSHHFEDLPCQPSPWLPSLARCRRSTGRGHPVGHGRRTHPELCTPESSLVANLTSRSAAASTRRTPAASRGPSSRRVPRRIPVRRSRRPATSPSRRRRGRCRRSPASRRR